MKPRPNFCGIGLHHYKDRLNVGSVMRAAHAFNANFVAYSSQFDLGDDLYVTDTSRAIRQIPLFKTDDVLTLKPFNASLVCVEFVQQSTSLVSFAHPKQAYYLFGPENGSLPDDIISKANRVIKIPTSICLNLAAAVNIVLYDRLAKLSRRATRPC